MTRHRLALVALLLAAAAASGCGNRPVRLRDQPLQELAAADVKAMLLRLDLFDARRNPRGRGLAHRFRLEGDDVVMDETTGLAWQRGGSPARLTYDAAAAYVAELPAAPEGCTGWRLPTVEEAMALLRPETSGGGLHLDPVFADGAWWIWTADHEPMAGIWVVTFAGGTAFVHVPVGGSAHVKAVCNPSSQQNF